MNCSHVLGQVLKMSNTLDVCKLDCRFTGVDVMLISLVLFFCAHMLVECRLTMDSSNNIDTNLVAEPDNIHSLYQSLFNMNMGGNNKKEEEKVDLKAEKHIEIVNRISIPESEGIRLLISVTSMLWDTAWKVDTIHFIRYTGGFFFIGTLFLFQVCSYYFVFRIIFPPGVLSWFPTQGGTSEERGYQFYPLWTMCLQLLSSKRSPFFEVIFFSSMSD